MAVRAIAEAGWTIDELAGDSWEASSKIVRRVSVDRLWRRAKSELMVDCIILLVV